MFPSSVIRWRTGCETESAVPARELIVSVMTGVPVSSCIMIRSV